MDVVDTDDPMLEAPSGSDVLPAFDNGWVTGGDSPAPFLNYTDRAATNWSGEFELLHEEASRTHFMDIWTREAVIRRVGEVGGGSTIADLGCSTGYLVEYLGRRYPNIALVGVGLGTAQLERQAAADVARTSDTWIGRSRSHLPGRSPFSLPFGIRALTVRGEQ